MRFGFVHRVMTDALAALGVLALVLSGQFTRTVSAVLLVSLAAALGVRETGQVLDVIRDLRKHDVSVIVVSHNMQQMMSIADRITVMRLGRSIATRNVGQTKVAEIVGLITGAIPGDDMAEEGVPVQA